jgi:CheY-like chemotaxis protein
VDVTDARHAEERKRELERQIEQSQRLESVGILAGGIAHDFNNLLTVILASADHARTVRDDSTADVEVIIEAARQAARLTQQLLAFSGRRELARESVDVAALIENVLTLARPTMPESVSIELSDLPSDVFVFGDRGQLEQVLMNLCLNARDAMPRGGTLRLAVEVGEKRVGIVVGDTGTGVAPEHLPHIFEPFFTTKGVGRGTGLGLAVAHGIVHQHQGEIHASSELGRGTEIRVGLPRHFSPPARTSGARAELRSGRGTVLLAEDEPLLRRISARILSEAGYRVLAVRDGLEAIREFEARGDEIDVMVLDVRMPRLDGVAAAQRIRARGAVIPALFCSGYIASEFAHHDPALGDRFIAKPYRADDLLAALSEMLEVSAAARQVRTPR